MNSGEFFCKNLYYLRKQNNLSENELCDKLGISDVIYTKMESSSNHILPPIKYLKLICNEYGISADDLLFRDLQSQPTCALKKTISAARLEDIILQINEVLSEIDDIKNKINTHI